MKLAQTKASVIMLRVFCLCSLLYGIAGMQFVFRGIPELIGVVIVLALSTILVIATRINAILFVLAFVLAYGNYSALATNYFVKFSDFYTAYAGTEIAAKGTYILLAFMAVLLLLLPSNIKPVANFKFFDRYRTEKYSLAFTILIAAVLVVILFTQSSGFSDTGGRASSNQLHEYSYILFIIGFYLSGKNKFCQRLLICVGILYIAQAILGGNRAAVLAIILLFYILFFSKRWPVSRLLPILILGFLTFQLVGIFRQNIDSANITEISKGLAELFTNGLVWDTAAAAYHQSLAFLNYADLITHEAKQYLTGQWILSIFMGGSALPDSNLSILVQHYFRSANTGGMGGGFLPLYGFFYFGILGVIASGGAVAVIFKVLNDFDGSVGNLDAMVRIALFSTVCRWYFYSPSPLTRGVLLTILVCGTMLLVTREKENTKNNLNTLPAEHTKPILMNSERRKKF